LELTMDELLTYISCPMRYALKYNAKFDPKGIPEQEEFKQALHTCIYYFWCKIMNENSITNGDLNSKWESLWFGKKNISREDIMYDGVNKEVKLGYQGFGYIQSFFNRMQHDPGVPICVAKDFDVPIGDHIIKGTFELIKETKENGRRIIEIVDYKISPSMPDKDRIERDIPLTIQSYAFRKLFQAKEQKLTYYYLNHNDSISAHRMMHDYNRVTYIVNSVAKSIEDNIYFPREIHNYLCRDQCAYKTYCKEWPS